MFLWFLPVVLDKTSFRCHTTRYQCSHSAIVNFIVLPIPIASQACSIACEVVQEVMVQSGLSVNDHLESEHTDDDVQIKLNRKRKRVESSFFQNLDENKRVNGKSVL